MQKKLIALAVAGLASTAAFAQTSVTVYGVADVTFESVKATGGTAPLTTVAGAASADQPSRTRVSANSSLLGFRGSEDLGNGLKANFQIESGIAMDAGGSTLGGRDTFVGLGGGFGEVRLGNNSNPYRTLGAAMDLNPGATGIAFNGALLGGFSGVRTGVDDRVANSVRYLSPNMSGFQADFIYGANENKTATRSDPTLGLGLTYANGPIYVGFAHESRKDKIAAAGNATLNAATLASIDDKITANRLGFKYMAGPFLGGLVWDSQKISLGTALISGDVKRTAWGLIGGYTAGAHAVNVQYTKAKRSTGSFGCSTAPTCEDGATMWSVGYNYSLSKRTMIKAYYAQISNKDAASYDFYTAINPVAAQTAAGTFGVSGLAMGQDPKGYGVGIRHSF